MKGSAKRGSIFERLSERWVRSAVAKNRAGAKAQIAAADGVLQAAGFARHGRTWNRRVDEYVDVVNLQESKGGESAYLNTGVYLDRVYEAWQPPLREGAVVHEEDCVVSDLHESHDFGDRRAPEAIAARLRDHVLPFFERMHSLEAFEAWLEDPKRQDVNREAYLAAVKHERGDDEGAVRVLEQAAGRCRETEWVREYYGGLVRRLGLSVSFIPKEPRGSEGDQ